MDRCHPIDLDMTQFHAVGTNMDMSTLVMKVNRVEKRDWQCQRLESANKMIWQHLLAFPDNQVDLPNAMSHVLQARTVHSRRLGRRKRKAVDSAAQLMNPCNGFWVSLYSDASALF